jgi:LysM repeat protein
LGKSKQKTARKGSTHTLVLLLVFFLLGGFFCSAIRAAEDSSKIDNLAEIESGFFVSKNDVYELRDQVLREKLLLFLAENGILTKSSRGLIYYHISEDAIGKIEDPEFREKVKEFVTEEEERKPTPQKVLHRFHEVEPGETLWNIAQRYGMSVDEIVRLNKLNPSETIYPGQKILVVPDWE